MLAGCPQAEPTEPGPEPPGWVATAFDETPRLRPDFPDDASPDAATGCLVPAGPALRAGVEAAVLAADERYVLLSDHALVAREDVRLDGGPESSQPDAAVVLEGRTARYGAGGCPEDFAEPRYDVAIGMAVSLRATYADALGRGFAMVGDGLRLLPFRAVERPTDERPWHASVQLIRAVDGGFLIGGGVLIDPLHLLTVAHMAVEPDTCWTREPDPGAAWAEGRMHCTVGSVVSHGSVDLAVVTLSEPAAGPFATLGGAVSEGEPFVAMTPGALRTRAATTSTVLAVGNWNASCADWPEDSSFLATDGIVGPGDSGGPVFAGGALVGLVHGSRCAPPGGLSQHVLVHLPALAPFIEAETG
jgi:hypothetical protein